MKHLLAGKKPLGPEPAATHRARGPELGQAQPREPAREQSLSGAHSWPKKTSTRWGP